jgi:hypothetical protein
MFHQCSLDTRSEFRSLDITTTTAAAFKEDCRGKNLSLIGISIISGPGLTF